MPYTVTLNLPISGLTLTAKVLNGATVEHTQAMPELTVTGVAGRYATTIGTGPTDGTFDVVAVDAAGKVYGSARVTLADGNEVHGYADVRRMNGATVIGTGQVGDDWRGVGVQPL